MKFVCDIHGEVFPRDVFLSFPAQADCPNCGKRLTDSSEGIRLMSKEEAVKIRPGFYDKDGNPNIQDVSRYPKSGKQKRR